MKALDIVKNWNQKKGTCYRFVSGDSDSSIIKRINYLIEKFGEDVVEKYYNKVILESEKDIWSIFDYWQIRRFKENEYVEENVIVIDEVQVQEEKKEEPQNQFNVISALGNELIKLMGSELANKINSEVENKLNQFVQDKTLIKIVEYKNERKPLDGIVHDKLETILKFVAMDEPVMLVGPAGTGKNVICKQIADSLGLEFYFSNAITQEYKLTGFVDAMGNYIKTQFYDAFTKGGLFLLDEMDASIPEVLVILNCAIANRYFDFPGVGRVNAHENFRIIACANTYGTGASMEYVGRNQLDGASLNRFAVVEVNYDTRIEENVSGGNKDILEFCREFRKICNKNGINHIVSYREIQRLHKMIDIANMEIQEAIQCCLVKGLEKDSIRMIVNSMSEKVEYKKYLNKLL